MFEFLDKSREAYGSIPKKMFGRLYSHKNDTVQRSALVADVYDRGRWYEDDACNMCVLWFRLNYDV